MGSGDNSESSGNLLSYRGGSDDDYGKDDGTRAIPQQLLQAIDQYRGNLSPATILTSSREGGNADATFADAQAVNRSLAVLNRGGEVRPASNKLDQNIRASGGTAFELGDSLEIGIQVSGGYESSWRHRATSLQFCPARRTILRRIEDHPVHQFEWTSHVDCLR